jgi:hypothetical protein
MHAGPLSTRGLLSCEHLLDARANFASVAACIGLRRQRVIGEWRADEQAFEAAGSQSPSISVERTRCRRTRPPRAPPHRSPRSAGSVVREELGFRQFELDG